MRQLAGDLAGKLAQVGDEAVLAARWTRMRPGIRWRAANGVKSCRSASLQP
jgi:tetraacyldisaccharide-1-P 4'-kinase